MFAPALAIDWLTARMADGNKWLLSLIAGISFLLVCMAVQWPFADFMVSSHARNHIFGMNNFPYMQPPSTYHFAWEFQGERLSAFWKDLGIGAARNEAIALEPPQRLDQHLLGDAADLPPQFRGARRAAAEHVDQQQRPFLGQQLQHGARRAVGVEHVGVEAGIFLGLCHS